MYHPKDHPTTLRGIECGSRSELINSYRLIEQIVRKYIDRDQDGKAIESELDVTHRIVQNFLTDIKEGRDPAFSLEREICIQRFLSDASLPLYRSLSRATRLKALTEGCVQRKGRGKKIGKREEIEDLVGATRGLLLWRDDNTLYLTNHAGWYLRDQVIRHLAEGRLPQDYIDDDGELVRADITLVLTRIAEDSPGMLHCVSVESAVAFAAAKLVESGLLERDGDALHICKVSTIGLVDRVHVRIVAQVAAIEKHQKRLRQPDSHVARVDYQCRWEEAIEFAAAVPEQGREFARRERYIHEVMVGQNLWPQVSGDVRTVNQIFSRWRSVSKSYHGCPCGSTTPAYQAQMREFNLRQLAIHRALYEVCTVDPLHRRRAAKVMLQFKKLALWLVDDTDRLIAAIRVRAQAQNEN